MTAYSFKERFAVPILAGAKIGTIREDRKKGHARPGTMVQLYVAMRTKHCRKITDKRCHAVLPIALSFKHREVAVSIAGTSYPILDLDAFAKADGFDSFDQMSSFWIDPDTRKPVDRTIMMNWVIWVPIVRLFDMKLVERFIMPPELEAEG